MTTATATANATTLEMPALTAHDRCDRCGAQAYLRATLPAGTELLFCGHHGNAHRPSLLVAGAALHDETDRLLTAQEPGSGG
jgi:ribosomal protein L37E